MKSFTVKGTKAEVIAILKNLSAINNNITLEEMIDSYGRTNVAVC